MPCAKCHVPSAKCHQVESELACYPSPHHLWAIWDQDMRLDDPPLSLGRHLNGMRITRQHLSQSLAEAFQSIPLAALIWRGEGRDGQMDKVDLLVFDRWCPSFCVVRIGIRTYYVQVPYLEF